jgi:hypothetical protein
MRKLTLIMIALFALAISSCKEEEKEHFMFLKFLAEARNPEEFLKSSTFYDSTCGDFSIDFKAIEWFSKIVKQNGIHHLILRSSGIRYRAHHETGDDIIDHFILVRLKDSEKGYYPVAIRFIKNEWGRWKLCVFTFLAY